MTSLSDSEQFSLLNMACKEAGWKGSLKRAVQIHNVFKATAHCIASARVHFGKAAITWRAMPSSHLLMLAVRIKRNAFSQCERDVPLCTVGVKFSTLLTMMRALRLRANDDLDVEVAPNSGMVQMRSVAGSRESHIEVFTMELASVDMEPDSELEKSLGEYPYVVTVRTTDLIDIKQELMAVSAECVSFTIANDDGAYRVGAVSCELGDEADGDVVKTSRSVLAVGGCLQNVQEIAQHTVHTSPMIRVALIEQFLKGKACSDTIEVLSLCHDDATILVCTFTDCMVRCRNAQTGTLLMVA